MNKEMIVKAPKLPNLRPYTNKWVALSANRSRVVASGNTIETVVGKISKTERKRVTFLKVFPRGYSPHHS